jgi:hypothetical protein
MKLIKLLRKALEKVKLSKLKLLDSNSFTNEYFDEVNCTCMIVNIKNYVGLCEKMSSNRLVNLLNNKYFELIHDEVQKNKGYIGRIIADRQYCIWYDKDMVNCAKNAFYSASDILKNHEIKREANDFDTSYDISICLASGKGLIKMHYGNSTMYDSTLFNKLNIFLNNSELNSFSLALDKNTYEILDIEKKDEDVIFENMDSDITFYSFRTKT